MPSEFVVDASDGNTPTHHALSIFRDTLKLLPQGLFGKKDGGKPMIIDTQLTGKAGETINYHYVPYADTDPILGQDASVQGNESSFNEYRSAVTIDEVNFAFLSRGKMTEQRTILDVRNEMRMQIAKHFAQYNMRETFKRLTGIAQSVSQATWESATDTTDRVNGGGRCIRASGSNGYATVTEANSDNTAVNSALATTDKMNPYLVMRAGIMARTSTSSTYKMQPLRVNNGKEFFKLYVAPECAYDLMTHPDWLARAIEVAGSLQDDPIAMGGLGILKNVIVEESEQVLRIVVTSGSDEIARNLLLGESAGVLAIAQTLEYVEQWQDYKRKIGVNGCEIRGELKLAFTDKDNTSADIDFGVAQVLAAAN